MVGRGRLRPQDPRHRGGDGAEGRPRTATSSSTMNNWSGRIDPDGNSVIYQTCGAPQNLGTIATRRSTPGIARRAPPATSPRARRSTRRSPPGSSPRAGSSTSTIRRYLIAHTDAAGELQADARRPDPRDRREAEVILPDRGPPGPLIAGSAPLQWRILSSHRRKSATGVARSQQRPEADLEVRAPSVPAGPLHHAPHEGLAGVDLRGEDELVGLVRLGDVARAADHGRHAERLAEDAGLGAVDARCPRCWSPTSCGQRLGASSLPSRREGRASRSARTVSMLAAGMLGLHLGQQQLVLQPRRGAALAQRDRSAGRAARDSPTAPRTRAPGCCPRCRR